MGNEDQASQEDPREKFSNQSFIITGEVILALIQTLAQRPYGEVAGLIQALTTLEENSRSEIIRP